MQTLTQAAVRAAAVNATRSEVAAITVPREFGAERFAELDFYGWRDPRIERRGYLVVERPDGLATVLVTTTATGAGTRRKAMCSVCRAVDDGSNVALFAARRTGTAGRRGDTVGTYICAGLDCSAQLRHPTHRGGRTMLADGYADDDERAAAMLERLDGFVRSLD
ncbi:FBP domain-containing protein [Jatrophihabitans fulvus]